GGGGGGGGRGQEKGVSGKPPDPRGGRGDAARSASVEIPGESAQKRAVAREGVAEHRRRLPTGSPPRPSSLPGDRTPTAPARGRRRRTAARSRGRGRPAGRGTGGPARLLRTGRPGGGEAAGRRAPRRPATGGRAAARAD